MYVDANQKLAPYSLILPMIGIDATFAFSR